MSPRLKHKWTLDELIDSSRDHIGSMLDNMKLTDIVDAMPYLAVAYLGYQLKNDFKDSAICMVGLKLATSMGGTPPASQIAGLGILGTYGIVAFTNILTEVAEAEAKKTQSYIQTFAETKVTKEEAEEYADLVMRQWKKMHGADVSFTEDDRKRLAELKQKIYP